MALSTQELNHQIEVLESEYKVIRDETQAGANTAARIGKAFLDLLYLLKVYDGLYISKAHDDETHHLVTFLAGLIVDMFAKSPDFHIGEWVKDARGRDINTGEGFSIWKNAVDMWNIEIDYATVRNLMRAKEIYANSAHIDEVTNQTIFKVGLQTLGNILIGYYAEGVEGGIITPEGHVEIKTLITRGLAKLQELFVVNDSTFGGNLSSVEFISAFLGGKGWAIKKNTRINAVGVEEEYYTLEIDNVTVRETLRVYEMIVSQLRGEFDNYVFAAMMEVHHYDPATGKVWLSTECGRIKAVSFRKGDYIKCQQFQPGNDVVSGGDGYITKSYELVVTDSGTGGMEDENGDRLDWVTFKNFTSSMTAEDGAVTVKDVPQDIQTKTSEYLSYFVQAAEISVPVWTKAFQYLSEVFYETYLQYYSGKSAYELPLLFKKKSLFPNVTEYYGRDVDQRAFDGVAGWLLASVLTELFPAKRNIIMATGYNLGPKKETYIYKYTFESDPNVGRLVASVICSAMRGRLKPNLQELRSEIGAPAFNYNIGDVYGSSFDNYKDTYYVDLTQFMPTAPGPYIKNYTDRSRIGGVPYDDDDLEDHNLQPDLDVHNRVVAYYNLGNPTYKQATAQAIANKESTVNHVFGPNRTGGGYTFHPVFGEETIGVEISVSGSIASAYEKIGKLGSRSRSPLQDGEYYGRKRPGQGDKDGSSPTGLEGVLVNLDIENSDGTPTGYTDAELFDRDSRAAVYANSYPSGHSSTTFAGALFLAELMPDKADLILKAANQYATDRQITRYHWLSDTIIGRLAGASIIPVARASADYDALLEAARAEIVEEPQEVVVVTTEEENYTAEQLIKKGDTFVRLDNETDPERKGLMQIITVGPNTPYQDVYYGMKTSPNDALKLREGNLQGIRTDLFGWLEGFGAYLPNIYAVGKMYNRQTGESLNSSIEITRERLKSVYSEVTYNISDEDNFLTNGFFTRDMEGWEKCACDGSAAPENPTQQAIDSGNGTPLMVNGAMLAYMSRLTAEVTDYDGVRVLHLLGMGVSQDFDDIKANDTHKENITDNDESDDYTNMQDVENALYMGIRMIAITAGTLTVTFMLDNGTAIASWSQVLNASREWMLVQARDGDSTPWEYTGKQGRMIVSYTGECYIRFIALRTDPIVNSRETYMTMFEQTSRHITLQARKQTADLNEAVADFTIKYNSITQTVTNNWAATKGAFDQLGVDISKRDQELEAQYGILATWKQQTDTTIVSVAANFDAAGNIKSGSKVDQTFQSVITTVNDNWDAAELAFQNLTDDLNTEVGNREALENAYHATWVYQNDTLLSLMAAEFDANGKIKGYADLKVQVNNISTTVTNNKSAADTAFQNINNNLDNLWDYAEDIDDEQTASATWISQNKNKWSVVAASFDSDGTVKASGKIGLYVSDKLSTFEVDADQINFKTGTFKIKNNSNEETFSVDSNGNVFIKGNIYGGNLTGDLTIGTGNNKMYIRPNQSNGAELIGVSGSNETIKLGFVQGDSGYSAITPQLEMKYYLSGTARLRAILKPYYLSIKNLSNSNECLIMADRFSIDGGVTATSFSTNSSGSIYSGVSGSFTAGSKTITVKGGIITGIS